MQRGSNGIKWRWQHTEHGIDSIGQEILSSIGQPFKRGTCSAKNLFRLALKEGAFSVRLIGQVNLSSQEVVVESQTRDQLNVSGIANANVPQSAAKRLTILLSSAGTFNEGQEE